MKHWSNAQVAARGVLLVGPLLALFPAPGALPFWAWILGGILGVALAREPDGHAGLGVIILTLTVWATAPGNELRAAVLVSAAVLVLVHVSAVLASYGPAEMELGRDLLTRWALRALALVAGAGVVFSLSLLVVNAGSSSLGWGAGVGSAVLLVLLARASLVSPRST